MYCGVSRGRWSVLWKAFSWTFALGVNALSSLDLSPKRIRKLYPVVPLSIRFQTNRGLSSSGAGFPRHGGAPRLRGASARDSFKNARFQSECFSCSRYASPLFLGHFDHRGVFLYGRAKGYAPQELERFKRRDLSKGLVILSLSLSRDQSLSLSKFKSGIQFEPLEIPLSAHIATLLGHRTRECVGPTRVKRPPPFAVFKNRRDPTPRIGIFNETSLCVFLPNSSLCFFQRFGLLYIFCLCSFDRFRPTVEKPPP